MDGENKGYKGSKPYEQMDDLGGGKKLPLFLGWHPYLKNLTAHICPGLESVNQPFIWEMLGAQAPIIPWSYVQLRKHEQLNPNQKTAYKTAVLIGPCFKEVFHHFQMSTTWS